MPQERQPLPTGSIIKDHSGNRYVIERLLGQGGSSAIYLVRSKNAPYKRLALKESISPTKQEKNHLTFEATVLSQLDHPALPHIYQVLEDTKNNRIYMLMDYIEGRNLEVLRQGQLGLYFSLELLLPMMKPIFDAIIYLHNQHTPVIHRDIKPANIIVSSDAARNTVLIDFGLAKEYVEDRTTSLFRYGTPGYAAPEQYGQGTNSQTDIYALGATLYTLLTGQIPIDALTRSINDAREDPLIPAHFVRPGITTEVSQVLEKAMMLRSAQRFSTVSEFWDTLNKATQIPTNTVRNSDLSDMSDLSLIQRQDMVLVEDMSLQSTSEQSQHQSTTRIPWYTAIKQTIASFSNRQKKRLTKTQIVESPLMDFAISYVNSESEDFSWALWIKQQLDTTGYTTILPPKGIRTSADIATEMIHNLTLARKVIIILSTKYLEILNSQSTWEEIFRKTKYDGSHLILPVYIQKCRPELKDRLESIEYINLIDIEESHARVRLLAATGNNSVTLATPPSFPGKGGEEQITKPAEWHSNSLSRRQMLGKPLALWSTVFFNGPKKSRKVITGLSPNT